MIAINIVGISIIIQERQKSRVYVIMNLIGKISTQLKISKMSVVKYLEKYVYQIWL